MSKLDDLAALGLGVGASDDAIRAAYRRLALEHHPDLGGDPAVMSRINQSIARLLEPAGEDPATRPTQEAQHRAPSGVLGEPISLWRLLVAFVVLPSILLVALFTVAGLLS